MSMAIGARETTIGDRAVWILPRTRQLSGYAEFEFAEGNHNLRIPASMAAGASKDKRVVFRGVAVRAGADKRLWEYFRENHPGGDRLARDASWMPAVVVINSGGLLQSAGRSKKIAPIPRGFQSAPAPMDPARADRHPNRLKFQDSVVPALSSDTLKSAVASRQLAAGVIGGGLVFTHLARHGQRPPLYTNLLMSQLEFIDWNHSERERGSPGHMVTSRRWLFDIELEGERVFKEFGTRQFVFFKGIVKGHGAEGVAGLLDVNGKMVGTANGKGWLPVQNDLRTPVLMQWKQAPRTLFSMSLSATSAFVLVNDTAEQAGCRKVLKDSALPLYIDGHPSTAAEHIFSLQMASAELRELLQPRQQHSSGKSASSP